MKFLLIFIFLLLFQNFAFALDETTVSTIEINNLECYDIEIYMGKENDILIPLKQILKILKIDYEQNHSIKEILFTADKNNKIKLNKNGLFLNDVKIPARIKYSKECILNKDEYFIDKAPIEKILNSKIEIDYSSLIVTLKNSDLINNETKNKNIILQKEKKAYGPDKKGKISFDTIEINNSTMSDSTKQVYLNASQNNVMFNNNTKLSLKGKIYDGDYSLNFNTNNYKEEFFSFGGLSFTYKNKYKNHFYELGQVSGFRDENNSIGTMLIGAQISNYDEYDKNKEERFEFLKKGNTKTRLFAGISGYNNRLFSSNGYIYQMTSKKFTAGFNRVHGVSDNIKLDTKIIFDKILQKNDNALFTTLYNDYSILSSGVYRNPNTMEGLTVINTFNMYKNKFYRLNAAFSSSLMKDYNLEQKGFNTGYSFSLNNIFDYNNLTFKLRLYQQSPDFYVAGTDSGFISDRLGGEITAQYAKENLSANLKYTRYYSNLDKRYAGGLASFDEFYLNSGFKLPKSIKVRLNGNLRYGKNNIGDNFNCYYNLALSKNITRNLFFEAGRTGNMYNTKYISSYTASNGFKSSYDTIYANFNYRLKKNKGAIRLGHDIVSYESNGSKNNYDMIKINYQFPEFKRLLLGLGIGYKYKGLDNSLAYSAAIGYRTKTGMIVSLNYQYNTAAGYMFNNMYIPSNARHSINITVNDTFAFANGRLNSIGTSSKNNGYVLAAAYIDKNNNGKFDKDDIKLKDIPFKLSWKNSVFKTKRNGYIDLQCVQKGYWDVELDTNSLHANLSAPNGTKKHIRVEPNRITRVEFPLISSIGNIKGRLKIEDDFKRKMNIEDFIVSIYDKNGKETAYSTVDKKGNYYFSGISPGEYTISLDKNFIKDYNLTPDEKHGKIEISIPYIYKKFYKLDDKNLLYKCY